MFAAGIKQEAVLPQRAQRIRRA